MSLTCRGSIGFAMSIGSADLMPAGSQDAGHKREMTLTRICVLDAAACIGLIRIKRVQMRLPYSAIKALRGASCNLAALVEGAAEILLLLQHLLSPACLNRLGQKLPHTSTGR